ncbi:MAG TPA: DUF373 family protein [Nitrosopumilus sp.]|nr:DUF373 family protein [Nitrosopumilus sp.]
MIKQIPILLIIVGIVVLKIGIILVMVYDLSFYTGITIFFGIAMIGAGINLRRQIKKLKTKNRKDHQDYTISKLMEEEDTSKNTE